MTPADLLHLDALGNPFVAHEVRQRAAFFSADFLELGAAEAGDEHADQHLAELERAGGRDFREGEGGVVGGEEGGVHGQK